MNADSEWGNGKRSDSVYIPKLPIQDSLPSFLVEIQKTVDEEFMQRVNGYSLQIIHTYSRKSIVFIICINKVTPKSFMLKLQKSSLHPWLYEYPCDPWGRSCFLALPDEIRTATLSAIVPLDPLLAVTSFITEQRASIFMHSQPEDTIIKRLYVLAMKENASMSTYKANFRNNLHTVCSTNLFLWEQCKPYLAADSPDINQAIKRMDQIVAYNGLLKRRYLQLEQDPGQSDETLEIPEILPLETHSSAIRGS